jgi:hypothetical protein
MLPIIAETAATDIAIIKLLSRVPDIALDTVMIAVSDDAAGNSIGVVSTEAVDFRLLITKT